jgi:hypothetical protein
VRPLCRRCQQTIYSPAQAPGSYSRPRPECHYCKSDYGMDIYSDLTRRRTTDICHSQDSEGMGAMNVWGRSRGTTPSVSVTRICTSNR